MATYSSYDQMKQELIKRGYPPDKAEKLASQKFIRKTGERPSKLKKAAKAPPPYDPSKKKKRRLNNSVEIIKDILTEIYGVTGLIGAPPATIAPSTVNAGVSGKATTNTPTKINNEKPETSKASSSKGTKGFSPEGIKKVKVEKAPVGRVTKDPEGIKDSISISTKQIEEEFGIK